MDSFVQPFNTHLPVQCCKTIFFQLICVNVLISSKDMPPSPWLVVIPVPFALCIYLAQHFFSLCLLTLNTDNTNSYSECYVQWYVQPPPSSPLFFALQVCFHVWSFHLQLSCCWWCWLTKLQPAPRRNCLTSGETCLIDFLRRVR